MPLTDGNAHFLWALLPLLALCLDLVLADPSGLPHPVQGIGNLANILERPARRLPNQTLAGALVLILLLLLSGGLATVLVHLPGVFGAVAALYLSWSGLALGGLLRHGSAALAAVIRAEQDVSLLPEARQAVQMLVSRDTSSMQAGDLYRSLAESVSENLNDAFVAPFFWLCLTGPVGLWLYKTVSTMDSMWGYRTEPWERLGKAAAKSDDVLAFIPARLTVFFMWLAVRFDLIWFSLKKQKERNGINTFPGTGWPGWGKVAREARKSASPNAGWPMAAAAWLFYGRTGGPAVYEGTVVLKPCMGPENGRWTAANTALLLRHVRNSGIVGGFACIAISALLHFLL